MMAVNSVSRTRDIFISLKLKKKKKSNKCKTEAKGQAGGQETGKPKPAFADIEISDTLHLEQ